MISRTLKKGLTENPTLGVEIAPNVRKIRMAISSKGRGKSGGARVITHDVIVAGEADNHSLYLVAIYDKADIESVSATSIVEILKESDLL